MRNYIKATCLKKQGEREIDIRLCKKYANQVSPDPHNILFLLFVHAYLRIYAVSIIVQFMD